MDQYWSWILNVGLVGFFLAGRKVWWSWYLNIANQVLWLTYSIVTKQYGFLVATFAYTFVFIKNAIEWTKDHKDPFRNFDFNEYTYAVQPIPYEGPTDRRECGWMGCGDPRCEPYCKGVKREEA